MAHVSFSWLSLKYMLFYLLWVQTIQLFTPTEVVNRIFIYVGTIFQEDATGLQKTYRPAGCTA